VRQSVPVIARPPAASGVTEFGREALPPRPNLLTALMLFAVFLAIATSGIVFTEPAPVDVLTMGLVVALPLIGLVRVTPMLVGYLAAWLLAAAAAFAAAIQAIDVAPATTHSAISVYLYAASFVFAAFVAHTPLRHVRLMLEAYVVAALFAATLGLIGYFDVVPGSSEIFTRYARATGAFKDPNVFGPFLVPAMIYLAHKVFTRPPLATVVPTLLLAYLGLALIVSFSRGAWLNFAVAASIYWLLAFATTPSAVQRLRMVALLVFGVVAAVVALAIMLQFDPVARMFEERAAVLQSYDVGPEGRFGGQSKALDTILDNPLGIGALNFPFNFHHEDAHNVYLSMLMNAGWAGGLLYLAIVLVTLGLGLAHALRRTPTQGLFLVAYAALVAIVVEGLIIDTDHWRHFYLLMGIVWGLMSATPQRHAIAQPVQAHVPRRPARITGRFVGAMPKLKAVRQPRRPARITGRARPRLPRHIALPRRRKITAPRRPARIDYR